VSSIMNVRPGRRSGLLTERPNMKRNTPGDASTTLCITSDMPDAKSSKAELVFPFLPTRWELHVDWSNMES
jgi:hypothetical protein